MKKTYKERFPGSTGMFTKEQITSMPYGGYWVMEQEELQRRFITICEAAVRMGCSDTTARKYLNDVDGMVMGDKMEAKVYYEKEAAVDIIKAYIAKKKRGKKDGKAGVN